MLGPILYRLLSSSSPAYFGLLFLLGRGSLPTTRDRKNRFSAGRSLRIESFSEFYCEYKSCPHANPRASTYSSRVDFLAGVPFFVTIIQIPQRYQIVNQTSAFDSGVRMLPFILSVPFCSAFSTMASSKLRVPPIFILVAAFVFQIVGIALLSTISVDTPPQTYGYEAILGIGIGLNFGSVIILTPNIVRGKDQCKPCFCSLRVYQKLNYSASCGHGCSKSTSGARRRYWSQYCV